MSFSSKKWNKFLLGEAEQEKVDKFLDRLSRVKPSEAPFNNIFKGKWRIAMDYSPKEFAHMRAIAARMEELGHEMEHVPQFPYKSATELEKPSEKSKEPWGWMIKTAKDKASWEKRSNMLYKAWIKAMDDAEAESGIDTSTFAGQGDLVSWVDENPDNPYAKDYKETYAQYKKHQQRDVRKTKLGKIVAREFKENREIVDSWNKSARMYQDDPNIFKVAKAAENYSMIVSRHPVDIYRMSDHAGITSCHSIGASHGHCATQEAEDFGMIAYVIETKDLERINLDDDEVFYDADRHSPGTDLIEPLARRRLRRYFNKKDNYDLAVPDTKEYGYKDIPGFLNLLVDWSREEQKDLVYGEDGKLNRPEISNFIRMGGSYPDAPDTELFNRMFKPKEEYRRQPAYKDDEGKIVEPSAWFARPYEQWLRAIEFAEALYERHVPVSNQWAEAIHYDTPGVYMDLGVDDHDGQNHPQPLEFWAILRIIMPKAAATEKGGEAFNDALLTLLSNESGLDDDVEEVLANHLASLETLSAMMPMTAFRQEELKSFKIQITFNTTGYRDDPAGFSDLTVDVVRDWSNILAAVKELEKKWKEAGVLKSDEKDKEEGERIEKARGQAAEHRTRQQRMANAEREYVAMRGRGEHKEAEEFIARARENDWYTDENPRPDPDADIFEQTEPYQRKVKAKHNRMKIRLIGVGGRSKSAPPAG